MNGYKVLAINCTMWQSHLPHFYTTDGVERYCYGVPCPCCYPLNSA